MTTNPSIDEIRPVPDGYRSLTPYLAVGDGAKAIDFYTEVFGAEVVSRNDLPDGTVAHAELRIGDSMLQLSTQMPQLGLRAPEPDWVHSSVVHYCADVDAAFARAIERGARQVEAVQTFVTGDRYGVVIDPFGHRWAIMTRVEDVSREEAERRVAEWLASQG
jgi:PhnB protein